MLVQANSIRKNYGEKYVLGGIDLSVDSSEVVSIIGFSGAGKSTFLKILGGGMAPDSGNVLIDGTDIYAMPSDEFSDFRNRKMGFIFQFHYLFHEYSLLENVAIPALAAGMSKEEAYEKSQKALELVGLGDQSMRKPYDITRLKQQKAAFARSIVNSPLVVFADEPSGNLELGMRGALHELLLKMRDEAGVSIVAVTHEKRMAQMSDRVLEINGGLLVQRDKNITKMPMDSFLHTHH